jgi:hypothetical protein
MTYELIEPTDEFEQACIKWTMEDGTIAFIPSDPNNSDYQKYLKWAEEQNG